MKPQNSFTKKITAGLGLLLLLAACSKKNDSAAPPVGTTPLACQGSLCASVGQIPGVLISALGTATVNGTTLEAAMDILGDATRININDPKAAIFYSGPAALSGYFRVSGVYNGLGFCGAYSGEYYVQAYQQGTMSQGTVTGGRLIGTGPNGGTIDVTLNNAVLYNGQDPNGTSKGSATNRIFMNMTVNMVNGQPCGLSVMTQ